MCAKCMFDCGRIFTFTFSLNVFDMLEILEDDEERLELETLHFENQMTCHMIHFWSSSEQHEYIINMLRV